MPSTRRPENIGHWEGIVDAWVEFVRGGFDVYREYVNSPAMLRRIGPVRGLDVLDLGCGEGYHSRILARRGARVIAVDATPGMIARARAEERRRPLGIRYRVADAAHLRGVGRSRFDLVASFMALMDIEDYRGAVRESVRVLRPGGRFVFSVPHPCFDTVFRRGKMVSGWVRVRERPPRGKALYFRVDHYFRTGLFAWPWSLRGTTARFRNIGWHLTLSDYVNALAEAGFVVRHLDEPRPTPKGVKVHPGLAKLRRVPHSIVVEAVKPAGATTGGVLVPAVRRARRGSRVASKRWIPPN